jgi:nucleoside-diphosphate-sugar epimerase
MRIAILGATSQIAKDLIVSFSKHSKHELILFARRPEVVKQWIENEGLTLNYKAADYSKFGINDNLEAIINFVGSGDPAQTLAMGATIFDVTLQYDMLALNYLQQHSDCRYIFLSSGAAFGATFEHPVDGNTKAEIAINSLKPQDWYAVAKLYAECRHRALPHFPIIDIRVFNYFSRTQDVNARFLITDILRAIRDKAVLKTSPDYIVRDFLHPSDFHNMINAVLTAPVANAAVDCYSLAPIDKPTLLATMQEKFGLQFEIANSATSVNATGSKPHYYSLNTRAMDFGYKPSLTSIEGLIIEIEAALEL